MVASRWTTDDTDTIAFDPRFYEYVWNGMDKAAARRLAKLDLLREFAVQAFPVYWPRGTLTGNGTTTIFNPKK